MNAIHPTAQLIGDVQLGSGNTIGPFVVIYGPAVVGDNNWIGAGAVIGATPEVRGFEHPADPNSAPVGGGITIGDRNVIREYVQIHQGWAARTVIGNDAFIMNQVYIAHDCHLGDRVTLASSVLLAGHVSIGSGANLGLGTSVHQRRHVGEGSMVGLSSVVTRDLPPFAKAYGSPARLRGANVVGMERSGISAKAASALDHAYRADSAESELQSVAAAHGLGEVMDRWSARGAA